MAIKIISALLTLMLISWIVVIVVILGGLFLNFTGIYGLALFLIGFIVVMVWIQIKYEK